SETASFVVAVSPLGYVAIWETMDKDNYHVGWQTWPHVQKNNESNEIWLDIEHDQVRVRINREWLWERELATSSHKIGIIGESFGGSAVVDFETLELFADLKR
ncbi:MAG: hypothetical protein R3293_10380, partial [Candidatus Promineifilaceae bacterium]|nr:hypothetical protein [Candidatus Promineifilaceae bacterium]